MGQTVLSFAACMGHKRIVKYLINEVEMDPNVLDSYGNNVLHTLCWWGYWNDERPGRENGANNDGGVEFEEDWDISDRQGGEGHGKDDEKKVNVFDRVGKLVTEGATMFHPVSKEEDEVQNDAKLQEIGRRNNDNAPFNDVKTNAGISVKEDSSSPDSESNNKSIRISEDSIYGLLSHATSFNFDKQLSTLSPAEKDTLYTQLRITADSTLANTEFLTPFLVAVSQGRTEMVQALVDYQSEIMWSYGPVAMYRFCLSELDTAVEKETMNHHKGALAIATEKGYAEIVSLPVFMKLLEAKWTLYGKRKFAFRVMSHVMYMVIFSLMIGLLPNDSKFLGNDGLTDRLPYVELYKDLFMGGGKVDVGESLRWEVHGRDLVRFAVEVGLVISNLGAMVRELLELKRAKAQYFTGFSASENMLQWANMLLFMFGVLCRFLYLNDLETTAWGLNAIFGWFSLLYFTKGSRVLGPLFLMFYKIVTGDLVRFFALVAVFLIGFGQAFWLQMAPFGAFHAVNGALLKSNRTIDREKVPPGFSENDGYAEWESLATGMVWSIRMFFGGGVYDDFRNAPNKFTLVLFLVFLLLVTILLINVFIAMLNSTFSKISENAEKEWRIIWADLIMEIDEKLLAKYEADRNDRLEKMVAKKKRDANSASSTGDVVKRQLKRGLTTLGLVGGERKRYMEAPITRIGVPERAKIFNTKTAKESENNWSGLVYVSSFYASNTHCCCCCCFPISLLISFLSY
jgi:hypothetical protein